MGCLIPFEISKKKGDFCSEAYNTKLEPFKRAKVREKKEVILESSKSFQKNENFEQVLKFRDNRNSKNATGACSTKIVVFFSLKLRLGKRKNKEAKIKEKKKSFFEDANKNGHHAKNCGKKPQHVRKKEISMKIKKFPELLKKHEK